MKRITISELYAELQKEEYPIIDKDEKMVYVVAPQTIGHDSDQTNRLFLIIQEDPLLLEEVEFDFEAMAKKLAEGFDPLFLVKTALQEATTSRLLEIKNRLDEKPDASVKTKPGCVSLKIGGRRGAPVELVLRR